MSVRLGGDRSIRLSYRGILWAAGFSGSYFTRFCPGCQRRSGKKPSGGQKKRLSIARAIVSKPEIIVLDDSASALDFATEKALREAILNLDYKPTLFIVSQRCSSILGADKIIVLEDGVCVGQGTNKELLNSCETYREIYSSQFSDDEEAAK